MWHQQISEIMTDIKFIAKLTENGQSALLPIALSNVRFPNDFLKYLYFCGKSIVLQGRYSDAQNVFFFLSMVRRTEPHYWNALGVSLFMDKKYDLAERSLKMSQLLECSDPQTYYHRALCLKKLYRKEDAINEIKRAIEKTENNEAYELINKKCKWLLTRMKE